MKQLVVAFKYYSSDFSINDTNNRRLVRKTGSTSMSSANSLAVTNSSFSPLDLRSFSHVISLPNHDVAWLRSTVWPCSSLLTRFIWKSKPYHSTSDTMKLYWIYCHRGTLPHFLFWGRRPLLTSHPEHHRLAAIDSGVLWHYQCGIPILFHKRASLTVLRNSP